MVRPLLDALYRLSGILAALFLALIGIETLARSPGVRRDRLDATEITGFSMAASTFLGLAYTLKSGAHIRVNLLITTFTGGRRRAAELWCIGIATLVVGYLAYQAIILAYES
jgi:TRAP-type C4-dicarboxylate transport system permease small subunit